MPALTTFPTNQGILIQGADTNGNPQGLNIGANIFTDNDGTNRAHALFTVAKTLSSNLTQNGLAANTLSNVLVLQTQSGFTLFVSFSAAATVTFFANARGGGAFYQLTDTTGAPLSITFSAGQSLAIPIPTGVYSIGVKVSATGNLVLEAAGAVGG
jgi:hypothetical protein